MKKNIFILITVMLVLTSCGNKVAAADSKEKMLTYLDGKFEKIYATIETNEDYPTTYYLIVMNGKIKDVNFFKDVESQDMVFEKANNHGKPGILWEKYSYDKEKKEIRFFKKNGDLIISLIFTTNSMKVNDYGEWLWSMENKYFDNNKNSKDEMVQLEVETYLRFGSEHFWEPERTYQYFIGKK